ncbi:ras-domain-containing protein [Ramicandelaber brevisporus]|nr:ras-domain-containing protein [Ramicandelaber brevisporus]
MSTDTTLPPLPDHHFIFKIVIVGDMSTGKTSLLRRLVDQTFTERTMHTIGVEFSTKNITIGRHVIRAQCWDTAGQERFRTITKGYYRGAAGAVLVYDIAKRSSFTHLARWIADLRSLASPNTVIYVVGNKADLADEREVSFEEAQQFCSDNGVLFTEASAKTGAHVEEMFTELARQIYEQVVAGIIEVNIASSGVQARLPLNVMYADGQQAQPRSDSQQQHEKPNCC